MFSHNALKNYYTELAKNTSYFSSFRNLYNLVTLSEINRKIHTPFSFDDFPSFINSEIHRGDELRNLSFYTMG